MRKLSLFTLTAVAATIAASPAVTSQAKTCDTENAYLKNDKCVVMRQAVDGTCNWEKVLAQLEKKAAINGRNNCVLNITFSDCNTSENEQDKWEWNIPENNESGSESDKSETGSPEQGETEQSVYAQQILELVNQERTKAGLEKVVLDENLVKAADVRAQECVASFSHTRPDGSNFSTVLSETGVKYQGAGENIAWGQKTPEEVMEGWMNSSGHRANILNAKFTTLGVGYYQDGKGTNYWAQLFVY